MGVMFALNQQQHILTIPAAHMEILGRNVLSLIGVGTVIDVAVGDGDWLTGQIVMHNVVKRLPHADYQVGPGNSVGGDAQHICRGRQQHGIGGDKAGARIAGKRQLKPFILFRRKSSTSSRVFRAC